MLAHHAQMLSFNALPPAAQVRPIESACGPFLARNGGLFMDNGLDRIDWINSENRLALINAVGQRALGLSDAQYSEDIDYLSLWLAEDRAMIADCLRRSRSGEPVRFTAASGAAENLVWWDVVISRVTRRHLVAQARDITAARTQDEGFRQRARHDDLTGLLNH